MSSWPALLFIFKDKNVLFTSFTDITFSDLVESCFLMYSSKLLVDVPISFAKFRPIWVNYSLKLSAIDSVSVMLFLSTRIFLGRFFCLYFCTHTNWFNIFTVNAKIISDFKFEILVNIYWHPTPFIMISYLMYTDIIWQFIIWVIYVWIIQSCFRKANYAETKG